MADSVRLPIWPGRYRPTVLYLQRRFAGDLAANGASMGMRAAAYIERQAIVRAL
jgi:hypothetical protein